MRETLAEGQILSRIGGEEFAVLLPGADEDEAQPDRGAPAPPSGMLADRRRWPRALPSRSRPASRRLTPGIESLSTLLRAADRALYAAKRAGRNRVTTSSSLAEAAR